MEWYIFAFISAFFSAAAAIYEKRTLFREEALEFSTILAIFNLFLALPFLFYADFERVTLMTLGVLYFKTILGTISFLCVMYGIKNLELSGALPLLVLTPGLVAFFAFILLGEALSVYAVFGMILLLIGTYILQVREAKNVFEPFVIFWKSKGHNYILAALLLFTTTSILDKLILGKFNVPPNAFMGFQHLFLGINFLIVYFVIRRKTKFVVNAFKRSWKMILIVAMFSIIYRFNQIVAVKLGPVALVLSIKRTSVFFATVIGGKLFREHNLLQKAIATLIMIIGSALVIIY